MSIQSLFIKFIFILCFVNISGYSQDISTNFKLHQKGEKFINWGYNRSWFNKSDLHLTGEGHDIILYDIEANDRPSKLSLDYINPYTWSIPQFNFRMGYFLSDKYSISIGWDHMKYVMLGNQTVNMYGYINPSDVADPLMQENMEYVNSQNSTTGLYNDQLVMVSDTDFLHYEHTDGLNYASIDVERYDELVQCKKHNKLGVSIVFGVGIGTIVPRTDAHLFGSGKNHFWNIAGWGTSAKLGIQINLRKHIYLQTDFKYGYLQMINVHTSNHKNIDKAQQHIVFYENYWLIGFRF